MKLKILLFFVLFAMTCPSHSKRQIKMPISAGNFFYISVSNVSTLPQTVSIEFEAYGGVFLSKYPSASGDDNSICLSNKKCTNVIQMIPVNGSQITMVSISSSATVPAEISAVTGQSGVTLQITVQEDRGAISAVGTTQLMFTMQTGVPAQPYAYFNQVSPFLINGGRPL